MATFYERNGRVNGRRAGTSSNALQQIMDFWAYMTRNDNTNYFAGFSGQNIPAGTFPVDPTEEQIQDWAEANYLAAEKLKKGIPNSLMTLNPKFTNAGYVLAAGKYPHEKNVYVPAQVEYNPSKNMISAEDAASYYKRVNAAERAKLGLPADPDLEAYQMYNGRPVVADIWTKYSPVTNDTSDDGYNPNAQYMYDGRPIVNNPNDNTVQTSYKPESFYAGGLPEHLRNTAPGVLPDLTKDDVFNMIKAGSTSKVMPPKVEEPTFWDNLTTGFSNLAKTNPMAFISAPLDIWNAFSAQRNAKQALNLYQDQFNMSKQAYERNEARNQEQFDMFKHARATSQL